MFEIYKPDMSFWAPTELLHLIWMFAYNFRLVNDPWRDVLLVLDIQKSIPECFLRDRLPVKWFCRAPHSPVVVNHVWQLYPPNPFKLGNPYLPSGAIVQNAPSPWSQVGGELLRLLSKQGLHKLRTYRRVVQRKYNQHINRSVYDWNKSFRDLFANVEWCRVDNYSLESCQWAWEFKHTVLDQLSHARFLTAGYP